MLTVVAAIIECNGTVLACQRRRDRAFPFKWEFPGGKVNVHETPAEALARELKEELGVNATIGEEIYRTRHKYKEMAQEIELIFFRAVADSSRIRNLEFEKIRWVRPEELPKLDFLAADKAFIEKLASGSLKSSAEPNSSGVDKQPM